MPPRAKLCDNCPFRPGTALHQSLRAGRLEEFRDHVAGGGWFPCHKTSSRRMDMEANDAVDGTTEWDTLDLLEKMALVAKEQECVGARIWRQEQRVPNDDE